MRYIFIILLFSLIFSEEKKQAYIQNFNGDVLVHTSTGNKSSIAAILGRSLFDRDILEVKGNSSCEIFFDDNRTHIKIDSNSKIKFIHTSTTREIYLIEGSLSIDNNSNHTDRTTFLFLNHSQLFLTNSRIWATKQDPTADVIYTHGKEINVSDVYKGNRLYENQNSIIYVNQETLTSDPSEAMISKIKKFMPDYLDNENIADKSVKESDDILLFDKNEADLIPTYYANVNTENIESSRGLNIYSGASQIYDGQYINFIAEPYFSWKNMEILFKLDGYLATKDSSININDWLNPATLLSKINYFSITNDSKSIFFNMGKLKNISFGHGQLLHNYSNSYNYPLMQRTGAQLHIGSKSNIFSFDFFIADIPQLFNKGNQNRDFFEFYGGMFGGHASLFLSKHIPLTLGFGYVVDFDQFSELDFELSKPSQLEAQVFDLEYMLFNNKKYKLNYAFEFDGIYFPYTVSYYRQEDESGYHRLGTWGSMNGLEMIFDSGHKVFTGLHYNGSLYTPYYFSSTYDFEKVRSMVFSSDNNAHTLNDNLSFLNDFCNSTDECTEGDIIFLTKELYPLFEREDFVHPTAGASIEYEYNYYNKRGASFSAMYLSDVGSDTNNSYYLLDFELFSTGGYLIDRLSQYKFYFHRNFANSGAVESTNENIMIGTQLQFDITTSLKLYFDFQNVFYDINEDAEVDDIKTINLQLRYSIF